MRSTNRITPIAGEIHAVTMLGVTIDGVCTGEWIYLPLIHMTR
jgi:hypothetical protein